VSDKAWTALTLVLMGGALVLVYLSQYNLPGNAAIPGRIANPIGYWGAILFFGSFALLGAYWLAVELANLSKT
jgi:hypothetical protein